ncbi:Uncharacterised protein [BD1-7 clade bacterium]|uniref:Uncharacterized protein n=1 Tax=BD1-7 clade bacterium TaxID=2029982 RepID=A0A5S9PWH8_9GAMM|nr:Uncharacterised protein [BD1-7 clade bacterium]CAA0113161.1 Uncharacterised protein [BD1-7 clade bacterium]
MEVNLATPADAKILAEIYAKPEGDDQCQGTGNHQANKNVQHATHRLVETLRCQQHQVYMVQSQQRVLGFCIVKVSVTGQYAILKQIQMAPHNEQAPVVRTLMEHIEASLAIKGCKQIYAFAQAQSRQSFQYFGFLEAGNFEQRNNRYLCANLHIKSVRVERETCPKTQTLAQPEKSSAYATFIQHYGCLLEFMYAHTPHGELTHDTNTTEPVLNHIERGQQLLADFLKQYGSALDIDTAAVQDMWVLSGLDQLDAMTLTALTDSTGYKKSPDKNTTDDLIASIRPQQLRERVLSLYNARHTGVAQSTQAEKLDSTGGYHTESLICRFINLWENALFLFKIGSSDEWKRQLLTQSEFNAQQVEKILTDMMDCGRALAKCMTASGQLRFYLLMQDMISDFFDAMLIHVGCFERLNARHPALIG